MWSLILSILLSFTGLFLIFLVLLQRGRGGGLAGAFGGLGGQSAFGTKAGDLFTKITIGVATFWVLLAGGTGIAMWKESEGRYTGGDQVPSSVESPEQPEAGEPAAGEGGASPLTEPDGTTPGGEGGSALPGPGSQPGTTPPFDLPDEQPETPGPDGPADGGGDGADSSGGPSDDSSPSAP